MTDQRRRAWPCPGCHTGHRIVPVQGQGWRCADCSASVGLFLSWQGPGHRYACQWCGQEQLLTEWGVGGSRVCEACYFLWKPRPEDPARVRLERDLLIAEALGWQCLPYSSPEEPHGFQWVPPGRPLTQAEIRPLPAWHVAARAIRELKKSRENTGSSSCGIREGGS